MLPIFLIGGGALGLLHFLNKKKDQAPPAGQRTGFAPAVPGPELRETFESLLGGEDDPQKLRTAGAAFRAVGYEREASVLEGKAARRSTFPYSGAPVAAPTGTVVAAESGSQTLNAIAKTIAATAQQKGSWYWDVSLVKAFQKMSSLPLSGMLDGDTLEALSKAVPESRGMFLNAGFLAPKMNAVGFENPPPAITKAEVEALLGMEIAT